ncbi:MAG TPA: 16S rRNA (adenine(1518)-N(6)/adenine(1519)-N(6))-dimethyltransferase RsmA, partial [Dehalococcoidia bacterium]|nr:16S rRNA (adenine(1518)-N(6)/adenine(1519)-N(6))-dimethyltransferase RsmA [Dehalococcoidia bacterium]
VNDILDAVPDDGLPILEIGPGRGVLTRDLAEMGRPLVAIDIDPGLAALLRRELPDRSNLQILNQDILDVDPAEALAGVGAAPPYGLVGNLPYAITALLFRKFLSEERDPPAWLLVMVQREVAQQVVAPAGKRSLLSISVQFYAQPELLFHVEREAFDPPPRVRSAVLQIQRLPKPAVEVPSEDRFFEVVRAGFRAPRKQLHNTLAMGLWLEPGAAKIWLEECDIDPTRRAATLTLEEWARLAWARERRGAAAAPSHRRLTA